MDILFNPDINVIVKSNGKCSVQTCNLPLKKRMYIFEDIDAMCNIVEKREEELKSESESEIKVIVKAMAKHDDNDDEKNFTLSDLLNAFDGVLELSDVILIMTTNYIEKLDSALIRHGRVNMRIHMKQMKKKEICEMLHHFFGDHNIICDGINDDKIVPATIESICQRSKTAKEAIDKIIDKQKEFIIL